LKAIRVSSEPSRSNSVTKKDGDDWKSSNRFTLDQLLRLRVCIDKSIDHISLEVNSKKPSDHSNFTQVAFFSQVEQSAVRIEHRRLFDRLSSLQSQIFFHTPIIR